MLKKILRFLAVTLLLNGCYFGRTHTAKRNAFIANGAMGVAGVLVVTSSGGGSSEGVEGGVSAGVVGTGQLLLGGTLLLGAIVGMVVNGVTPTDPPAVAPAPVRKAAIVTNPGAPLSAALELDVDRALEIDHMLDVDHTLDVDRPLAR